MSSLSVFSFFFFLIHIFNLECLNVFKIPTSGESLVAETGNPVIGLQVCSNFLHLAADTTHSCNL